MAASDPSEPRERLGFLIYRSGLAVSRGFERALKPISATPSEAGVLSALSYSGPNHVRGLARLLGLGRQTIVNVIKQIEDANLISRSVSKEDARLSILTITVSGRKKLAAIEKIASAFDEELRAIVGRKHEAEIAKVLQLILDAPFFAYED